jgi:transcriptional regulator with XRE-family HTH domain
VNVAALSDDHRISAQTMGRAMTFAEALTSLMTERGMSGRGLARRIPCDNSAVCRYKSGKLRPSPETVARIDDLLGANGELKALARAEAGLGRRAVLAGGLLAGALLGIGPDAADRLAWTERHPSQIDTAAVESLALVLAGQRRAEDALGSAAMLGPVTAQLTAVENLTAGARGPLRLAVLDIAQQWTQFAAWLHMNVRDFPAASARWRQTLELGEIGETPPIWGNTG